MSIQILTDSTSDLSPELVKRFAIHSVPLTVAFGNEAFLDGVEINAQQLIDKIASTSILPKTTQPSPAEFLRKFRELLSNGDEVIYIGLSSKISGTFTSAQLALGELGDAPVSLIDSLNLSMGIGLLILHVGKMVQEGLGRLEIVRRIEKMVPKVRTAFVVDTLDFLHKGGRLSAVEAFVGNILNIHPMIQMTNGVLGVGEKIRGRRERALERMLEIAAENPEQIDPEWVSVTHVACPQDAEILAEALRSRTPVKEVVITKAGAVIASHCGPGTIGILYIER
jgi:DegV family protein with EDD domain